ncbi:Protein N-acetyltransferase, RimJ/RimL family [Halogranum amylolyticum]|uniref:Protein N-acetyltransferase, RimJ/RimL family n=1 Tax=Halogranum amylolyticum TaxID=660520 RepID=A0A1H8RIE2_9EURY|nr:GNAT family N-acetyltransferase [Halogranum amylolyticum]SEO66092.1 Protein N-acetyltransferase, RimJ/RimL family [Halogranum amylolyticum]
MFPDVIETDRLRLRRFDRETVDALDLYEYAAKTDSIDEETRYVTWEPHATPKESWDFLRQMEEAWDDAKNATYAVFPKEGEERAGEFAGNTGLGVDWDKRKATLGVWLRRPFWGRGYSGERATALVELGFDVLDLDYVTVCHAVDNEQSRRAIEKYVDRLGGQRDGIVRNRYVSEKTGEGVDEYQYSISQEQWHEVTGGERTATFRWD